MKTYKFAKQITINGRRKVFRADSQRELNRKIMAYQGEKEKGALFSEVAEKWKEAHWKHLSFNSTKNYSGALSRIVDQFGDERIKNITPLMLDTYLKQLVTQDFAKNTISNTRCVLNLIFTYAVVQGDLQLNPCACVKVTQGKASQRRRALTPNEIRKVIVSKDIPFGLYAFFLLYTGMRPSEPLAITGADIDLKSMTIDVNKSVYWDNHSRPHIKEPKTEAGKRKVLILSPLRPYLEKIKRDELLFGIDGKLMAKGQYDALWERYRKQTGLTITPYQLRHTFSTMCKKAGIDVKDTQHLMGHANYATTMDIYTHYDEEARKANYANLDAYVHTLYTPNGENADI